MPGVKATLATRKRALALGAQFIENDLGKMRERIQRHEGPSFEAGEFDPTRPVPPDTTSHEGDFLKATEWASAATWLRAMAEAE